MYSIVVLNLKVMKVYDDKKCGLVSCWKEHSLSRHCCFTGSMAGLAIAMLVIGILLAIGVSFGISKYKGTTSWNPATKLENLG